MFLDDHKKRIVLGMLSNEYNFKKMQLIECGDFTRAFFIMNEMEYTATLLDNVWKFECNGPQDTEYTNKKVTLPLSDPIIVSFGEHVHEKFRKDVIVALSMCNVSYIMSKFIYKSILWKLDMTVLDESKIDYRNLEGTKNTVAFLPNPVDGIEFFAIKEHEGALVLYYKVIDEDSKHASDYKELIEGIAFRYVDFCTDDISPLQGIL